MPTASARNKYRVPVNEIPNVISYLNSLQPIPESDVDLLTLLKKNEVRMAIARLRSIGYDDLGVANALSSSGVNVPTKSLLWAIYKIKATSGEIAKRSRGSHPEINDEPSELNEQIKRLLRIPGVSRSIAKKLADSFPSIDAIALASEAQLQTVRGIGPNVAMRIKDALKSDTLSVGHSE